MTTLIQRLRQMADHTGLDAVAELLREAATELERQEDLSSLLLAENTSFADQILHHEELLERAALAEQPAEQEPVAWVWNPISESWERVRAFGHWQQGAIYAFGPEAPQPAIQPGYKLVPVEPSIAACINGSDAVDRSVDGYQCAAIYRAMLNAAPEAPQPAKQHPDDAAVDVFAQALKDKLAAARAKGRGGWQTCPPDELSRMLREHVEKGDPRDVANFCMFLWSLGHGISAPAEREPFGYLHPTGRHPEFRFFQNKRDGVDGMPVYTVPQPADRYQIRPRDRTSTRHHRRNQMTYKQLTALQLADVLDVSAFRVDHYAANELRRLHEANQYLLEALRGMLEVFGDEFGIGESETCDIARAAISAYERKNGITGDAEC